MVSRPSKFWWLLALVLLCLFLLVQLPASWLVQKFLPNNPYLQQVSGNLWEGQSSWQVFEPSKPNQALSGTLNWHWKPIYLLSGKVAMSVEIRSGQTLLNGLAKVGKNSWQINDFKGKISKDTLSKFGSWQLPDTPILVESLSLSQDNGVFSDVAGQLSWLGGNMGYPSGGRVFQINLPKMQGVLSKEKTSGQAPSRLHLALTTMEGQRLGDLYVDNDKMLDVALTQRLLKNMPDYTGQGADDSVVVSLRQPLLGSF